MSTVVYTTPMCRLGRPPLNMSSAVTKRWKLVANSVCLSAVDFELSITNSRSISVDTGMSFWTAPFDRAIRTAGQEHECTGRSESHDGFWVGSSLEDARARRDPSRHHRWAT